jgi:uncharacterized protein (DUF1697 family)
MAERYVALLRGINVGRARRVAMADLRALVEGLGYTDVKTLLNSGNITFSASDEEPRVSAERIERELARMLGVSARVTALSATTLARIVDGNPLVEKAANPSRLLVAFLADTADVARLEPLTHADWTPEGLALGDGVAYVWCPGGVSDSKVGQAVGAVLGDAVTSRNWATVLKLQTLAEQANSGRVAPR